MGFGNIQGGMTPEQIEALRKKTAAVTAPWQTPQYQARIGMIRNQGNVAALPANLQPYAVPTGEQQQTNRQLNMLRQELGNQRDTGVDYLRHSLAARGLMGSGTEWQGRSDLENSYMNAMARGTQDTLSKEIDRMVQRQQWEREMRLKRQALEAQTQQNPWWTPLMTGIGTAVGGPIGGAVSGGLTDWLSRYRANNKDHV